MKDKVITFETTKEERKLIRKINRGEESLETLDKILELAKTKARRRIK